MSKDQFVYVAEFDCGLVKVGFSCDPDRRLKQLSTTSLRKLRNHWLSKAVRDGRALESEAHLALVSHKFRGEWFHCSFKRAVEIVDALQVQHADWTQEWAAERRAAHEACGARIAEAIFGNSHRRIAAERISAAVQQATDALVLSKKLLDLYQLALHEVIGRQLSSGEPAEKALIYAAFEPRAEHVRDLHISMRAITAHILSEVAQLGTKEFEELIALVSADAEDRVAEEEPFPIEHIDNLMLRTAGA